MFKIGVIGSGKGSNFVALADAVNRGQLDIEISVVISDVENAFILDRAKERGIESLYIPPGKFKTKLEPEVEQAYVNVLKKHNVDLVVLAGFMRIIKNTFLREYPKRIINIHPSLLPSFKGLEAWKQALEYGVKVAGCTVHFVDEGVDCGPIIIQREVMVKPDDTPERLHERIQVQEHIAYPEAVCLISNNAIIVEDRVVRVKE
ncbi:MAG: phosphoribosylglycinamide formyltransferase [Candidatus Theseobacter exili]|nr:phosphoribosylglycinamide formyltransferase [Candidatus Theseobacter exili]